MAYNSYQPYYSNYYQPQTMPQAVATPQVAIPQQTQPVQQIQNSGFVNVRSEEEARNYPIAYGNSVTFKNETAPYVYTKTMGFSQLDRPVFEKYKLVKEETEEKPVEDDIRKEIEDIWKEINLLKEPKKPVTRKKDEVD